MKKKKKEKEQSMSYDPVRINPRGQKLLKRSGMPFQRYQAASTSMGICTPALTLVLAGQPAGMTEGISPEKSVTQNSKKNTQEE